MFREVESKAGDGILMSKSQRLSKQPCSYLIFILRLYSHSKRVYCWAAELDLLFFSFFKNERDLNGYYLFTSFCCQPSVCQEMKFSEADAIKTVTILKNVCFISLFDTSQVVAIRDY